MDRFKTFRYYLQHRQKAKKKHGIHSPFVYHFATEVLYQPQHKKAHAAIEAERRRLLKDKTVLPITDLGAGSKKKQGQERTIQSIAKNALKTHKEAELIGRIVRYYQPQNILELGTSLGITTAYLSKNAPEGSTITTMEGAPAVAREAQNVFDRLQLDNIRLCTGHFDDLLPEWLENNQPHLVFVDGNHQKAATLKYFNIVVDRLPEEGILIFDDIYWSEGMMEAWKTIIEDPRATVTIDLFFLGVVFKRSKQAKEHFNLKFPI